MLKVKYKDLDLNFANHADFQRWLSGNFPGFAGYAISMDLKSRDFEIIDTERAFGDVEITQPHTLLQYMTEQYRVCVERLVKLESIEYAARHEAMVSMLRRLIKAHSREAWEPGEMILDIISEMDHFVGQEDLEDEIFRTQTEG